MEEEKETGYMSIEEMAEMLGIGVTSVYALIKAEGFPSIPNGKSGYVVPRITFMNWLADPRFVIEFKNKVKGCSP